ncbi:LysR family transcriptional regulator [Starkeya sp. ORNL1]|uniref:LysR family transcriptional regulator n=1 Tax=Starkeya sp. ORNL1 TaxID=2709380 RepID=UPI001463E313|nr:LysR family transcriptional regulator [Starkeya sp. ORNL1]QJP14087.1 LysR family transcriptional regulator [Starkeya sp. ORNL1]
MDNRAGEMEVFAAAAELGSFSAAGRQLKLTPSAVSKLITRIEDRLGTRLLLRSTRALRLTPEGERYLARALRILAEIEETEREIASGSEAAPRGRVRVNASVGFGVRCIMPLIPEFLRLYPEVELDLSLNDGMVDLMEGRADIAIRSSAAALPDSSLKARKIRESRRVVVAAPSYLAVHGIPQTPADLARHNCLRFNFRQSPYEWPFRDPVSGEVVTQQVTGNFLADNGPTLRQLCVEGLGLARIGQFHVAPDIAEGRLVPVLERYNPEDVELIHAIFAGHQHLPARVRAFVDFLAERIRGEA